MISVSVCLSVAVRGIMISVSVCLLPPVGVQGIMISVSVCLSVCRPR